MSADQKPSNRMLGVGRERDGLNRAYSMLIDGAWTRGDAKETFQCVDPYTGEPFGSVPQAGAADVHRAVSAARRAFDHDGWPQTAAAERAALLKRLARAIEAHADELAYVQIRENGKLVSEMRPQIDALVRACEYFAGLAESAGGRTVPLHGYMAYTVREPIGVVAAITPWNSPLLLLGWKLFPALAA